MTGVRLPAASDERGELASRRDAHCTVCGQHPRAGGLGIFTVARELAGRQSSGSGAVTRGLLIVELSLNTQVCNRSRRRPPPTPHHSPQTSATSGRLVSSRPLAAACTLPLHATAACPLLLC